MLNDRERSTLHDIERHLLAEDPTWASRFNSQQRTLESTPRPAWLHHMLMMGIALAAILATIMMFAGVSSLTAFFIVLAAAMTWLLDPPAPTSRSDRHGNPDSAR